MHDQCPFNQETVASWSVYFICVALLLEIYGEFLPFLGMLAYFNYSLSVFENVFKFYTNVITMVWIVLQLPFVPLWFTCLPLCKSPLSSCNCLFSVMDIQVLSCFCFVSFFFNGAEASAEALENAKHTFYHWATLPALVLCMPVLKFLSELSCCVFPWAH